jgi:outer membrane protein assembly factor BamB
MRSAAGADSSEYAEGIKDGDMSNGLRNLIVLISTAALIGCAAGPVSRWRNFHGDTASRGFQPVESGFALSANWVSKPYQISSSSPVIGVDYQGREIVYIGTTNGRLIALRSEDGSQKWQRSFGPDPSNNRIVGSPSVSARGDIFVITNRESGDGIVSSTLHKVDQFSNPQWSYSFPDNGYTTGSPKVISSQDGTQIIVYLSVGMPEDVQGELFVLRDNGSSAQLAARKSLGFCRFGDSGGRADLERILDAMKDSWNMVETFPIQSRQGSGVPPESFVDPTVAIDTIDGKTLIAIADSLCSIGAYEWDQTRLTVLWRQAHEFKRHSSAAVLPGGQMVFGDENGKVWAYDTKTGVKMWEYDAGQPVLATPAASAGQLVFVVSSDHLQVLNATDGNVLQNNKAIESLPLMGNTHSSPGVTSNRVYVSSDEMLTATYDLKARSHDTNFHGNRLSSIAIGRDGAVYAVAEDGTLVKYAGKQ